MNALCGVQGIAAAHLMADVGAAVISAGILLHWLRASVEKRQKYDILFPSMSRRD